MSEKPQNVEAEGEDVLVRAHLTHAWQDGLRHPIVFLLDRNGKIDYSEGFYLKTDGNLQPNDERLFGLKPFPPRIREKREERE